MPYIIKRQLWRPRSMQWVVTKRFTGKVIGMHESREKAQAQIVAIHIREGK